jgi:hypothetical protein
MINGNTYFGPICEWCHRPLERNGWGTLICRQCVEEELKRDDAYMGYPERNRIWEERIFDAMILADIISFACLVTIAMAAGWWLIHQLT